MQKVKNTIPVYDICSLSGTGQIRADVVAQRFGEYLKVHPNLHRAHGHSFYHMVLFTKGKGFHTIDFERFPVQIGQVYFMVPGQVHSWGFEGDIDGYVVNFSDELFRPFLADAEYLERFSFWAGITGVNVIKLPPALQKDCVEILERVVQELAEPNPLNIDMIRVLLLSLFILVERSVGRRSEEKDIAKPNLLVLYNFRKLLNHYYTQYKLPKDYAAMLYVTPNHLNALTNDLLGRSAGEVIRERILLEAKRLLVNTDSGIAGIGYVLGFTDNSYFTKFFKKYTGITPEDFKQSWQKQPAS